MYAFIEGKIADLNPAGLVLNCNGVGYQLNISLNTYSKLNGKENCRVYTHLVVREDALVLFGFADEAERSIFQLLISVSGVGPNTARLILSALTPDEITDAIVSENVKALQSVKGIGSKSALRLIVDLKGPLSRESVTKEIFGAKHNTAKVEALSALVMLGFNKAAADKALEAVVKQDGLSLPVEQMIKNALKIL
ncbi:MAG TPA: Holliday junction branch migration protein RuvA [Bacteroidales bacterium]|nr:Holliday junction branch migration protein RuvA [Bacteroidales bacterium]HPT02684.1 Holliday junction branch migration protein RuvA [Bacteroidales bacterium]